MNYNFSLFNSSVERKANTICTFLIFPDIKGTIGPGGAVLERNASLDNVLETSRSAKNDHMNEYNKIKEVT